jgi:hypothetical protein
MGKLFLPKESPSPIITIGVLHDLPYCLYFDSKLCIRLSLNGKHSHSNYLQSFFPFLPFHSTVYLTFDYIAVTDVTDLMDEADESLSLTTKLCWMFVYRCLKYI